MKLTKPIISKLSAGNQDKVVWDDSLPGFGVRVKPTGVKSYILQYRNRHGSSKRLTLGRVGQITLDKARKEAVILKGSVSLGEDPALERHEARTCDTIRDLSERYMDDHCKGRCKESTMTAHQWLLDKYVLPKFGARKITELQSVDIAKYHQSLRKTPYNANRILGLIKAMYGKAEQWGLIPANGNPATTIKPFTERKRQRFLSATEFKTLFSKIDELEKYKVIGTYQAAAIRLLALTGCRLSEILTLKWSSVDFVNNRLLLEYHKTDRKGAKAIPLNTAAKNILQNLPHAEDNEYVIVGKNDVGHIVNLQKPWGRIRTAAKLEDVRIHDLRHSFASAAASAGIPLQIIGGMLGHSSPQTTARYAHLSQDPVHQASEVVGSIVWKTGP
jgi:integrase